MARNLDRGTSLGDGIEVADSFWGKFRGLMLRPPLPVGGGLWLPGGNGIHMMFMRFPIDVVFLARADDDGSRAVVAIRESLPAWTGIVPFVRRADGCLELPAGVVTASGTRVGDRVILERVGG